MGLPESMNVDLRMRMRMNAHPLQGEDREQYLVWWVYQAWDFFDETSRITVRLKDEHTEKFDVNSDSQDTITHGGQASSSGPLPVGCFFIEPTCQDTNRKWWGVPRDEQDALKALYYMMRHESDGETTWLADGAPFGQWDDSFFAEVKCFLQGGDARFGAAHRESLSMSQRRVLTQQQREQLSAKIAAGKQLGLWAGTNAGNPCVRIDDSGYYQSRVEAVEKCWPFFVFAPVRLDTLSFYLHCAITAVVPFVLLRYFNQHCWQSPPLLNKTQEAIDTQKSFCRLSLLLPAAFFSACMDLWLVPGRASSFASGLGVEEKTAFGLLLMAYGLVTMFFGGLMGYGYKKYYHAEAVWDDEQNYAKSLLGMSVNTEGTAVTQPLTISFKTPGELTPAGQTVTNKARIFWQ